MEPEQNLIYNSEIHHIVIPNFTRVCKYHRAQYQAKRGH